jgi:hypothetical protein
VKTEPHRKTHGKPHGKPHPHPLSAQLRLTLSQSSPRPTALPPAGEGAKLPSISRMARADWQEPTGKSRTARAERQEPNGKSRMARAERQEPNGKSRMALRFGPLSRLRERVRVRVAAVRSCGSLSKRLPQT